MCLSSIFCPGGEGATGWGSAWGRGILIFLKIQCKNPHPETKMFGQNPHHRASIVRSKYLHCLKWCKKSPPWGRMMRLKSPCNQSLSKSLFVLYLPTPGKNIDRCIIFIALQSEYSSYNTLLDMYVTHEDILFSIYYIWFILSLLVKRI